MLYTNQKVQVGYSTLNSQMHAQMSILEITGHQNRRKKLKMAQFLRFEYFLRFSNVLIQKSKSGIYCLYIHPTVPTIN